MPFKQAFGAAALPVAGAFAVAIAAAIGYVIYTGAPQTPQEGPSVTTPAPQAEASSDVAPSVTAETITPNAPPLEETPRVADAPKDSMASGANGAEPAEKSAMPESKTEPKPDVATSGPSDSTDGVVADQEAAPSEAPSQIVQAPTAEISSQSETGPGASAPDTEDTAAALPALSAPTVDIVRIPPTGISTVAGRADPNTDILIFVDGVEVARAKTGAGGDYVALFDIPAVERPRELQIAADKGDRRVFASGSIVIAPFIAGPVADPVAPAPNALIAQVDPETPVGDEGAVARDMAEGSARTNDGAEQHADAAVAQADDAASMAVDDQTPVAASQPSQEIAASEPEAVGPATPPTSRPAPTVMVADDTGVKILQSAAPIQGVSIDAITYDPDGAVFASGRGISGAVVRLYLSNTALMDTPVGTDGQWRAEMDVKAGIYSLRADMVDEAGKVLGRVEIPFKREDVTVLAGLAERATQEAAPEQAKADVAQDQVENAATERADGPASAIPQDAPPQDAPQPRIASVTVQPGNTLWGIASQTYGDGFLYARVFNANVAQIRDPDLIYPGQVFVLPQE